MDKSRMKNMVVLKDLPSNIVDEAIIILKPNIKIKDFNMADNKSGGYKKTGCKKDSKNYIIDEAQMVISNYLLKIEEEKKMKYKDAIKIENKYKILKTLMFTLTIVCVINYIFRFI